MMASKQTLRCQAMMALSMDRIPGCASSRNTSPIVRTTPIFRKRYCGRPRYTANGRNTAFVTDERFMLRLHAGNLACPDDVHRVHGNEVQFTGKHAVVSHLSHRRRR